MLWIVLIAMLALAIAGVAIPLARRHDRRAGAEPGREALGRALADIDRRAAAEAMPAAVAEGLRNDAIQRFLAGPVAAAPVAAPISPRMIIVMAFAISVVIAIGAGLLYGRPGRPAPAPGQAVPGPVTQAGAPSVAAGGASQDAAPSPDPTTAPGGVDAAHVGDMIARLEASLRRTPADAAGWRMLAWSYSKTGRYARSAAAFARAAALDPRDADARSSEGEALTKAAGGRVTAQARQAFAAAVAIDPGDARARYFLAAAKYQSGDHAGAMADWIALLKTAPPGAAWAVEVRAFVQRLAAADGQDIPGPAPPAASESSAVAAP